MWKPHCDWCIFSWHWWPPYNIFKLLICRVCLPCFIEHRGPLTEGHLYSLQTHLFSTCWHCTHNQSLYISLWSTVPATQSLLASAPDESGIGKLRNCSHSLTFTAPFSVGHGSGPSLGLNQWDGELQWVWVGLGDRTLPHTPGAHQHSSKPWDGAWKLILVSLCCSFSPQMPHRCSLSASHARGSNSYIYVPLTKRNGKEEEAIPCDGNKHVF